MSNSVNAFCSWSGGKDCCLALHRYKKNNPDKKIVLLTMLKKENSQTYGHFVNEQILRRQADAMGLEIFFGYSNSDNYEEIWCTEIEKLKLLGAKTAIFGDIDLDVHYFWIKRIMEKMGLQMEMPLWKENRLDLVNEVVDYGYRIQIISIKNDKCPIEYLGNELDKNKIIELNKDNIDPSAEGGEFHTLVTTGPIFIQNMRVNINGILNNYNHTYLCLT